MYILNKFPSKTVSKTLFETWNGWRPRLRHLRIWGCPVKVMIYNHQLKKLDLRIVSHYSIGYPAKSKGYRFYCPLHTIRIVQAKNAKFLKTFN